jgi:hypothetical protein
LLVLPKSIPPYWKAQVAVHVKEKVVRACKFGLCVRGYHVRAAEEDLQMPCNGDVPPAVDAATSADEMCDAVLKEFE